MSDNFFVLTETHIGAHVGYYPSLEGPYTKEDAEIIRDQAANDLPNLKFSVVQCIGKSDIAPIRRRYWRENNYLFVTKEHDYDGQIMINLWLGETPILWTYKSKDETSETSIKKECLNLLTESQGAADIQKDAAKRVLLGEKVWGLDAE